MSSPRRSLIITPNVLWQFPGFLLPLAFASPGCRVTTQELRRDIQDERRGAMENMAPCEKTYESREYLGVTSKDQKDWNPLTGLCGWTRMGAAAENLWIIGLDYVAWNEHA